MELVPGLLTPRHIPCQVWVRRSRLRLDLEKTQISPGKTDQNLTSLRLVICQLFILCDKEV